LKSDLSALTHYQQASRWPPSLSRPDQAVIRSYGSPRKDLKSRSLV